MKQLAAAMTEQRGVGISPSAVYAIVRSIVESEEDPKCRLAYRIHHKHCALTAGQRAELVQILEAGQTADSQRRRWTIHAIRDVIFEHFSETYGLTAVQRMLDRHGIVPPDFGRAARSPRGAGRFNKLNDAQLTALRAAVKHPPTVYELNGTMWTLISFLQLLEHRFGVRYTGCSARRVAQHIGLLLVHPVRAKTPRDPALREVTTGRLSPEQAAERRLRAMRMLDSGMAKVDVAWRLGVSQASVSAWAKTRSERGLQGLLAAKPSWTGRLSVEQCERLMQILIDGPGAHHGQGSQWTIDQLVEIVKRYFGISYSALGLKDLINRLLEREPDPAQRAAVKIELGGPVCRLSQAQLAELKGLIAAGPPHEPEGSLWTVREIRDLIESHFGVVYSYAGAWHMLQQRGLKPEKLRPKRGRAGKRRLPPEKHDALRSALTRPPSHYGIAGQAWSVKRVQVLLDREFGVSYGRASVSQLLRRIGWSAFRLPHIPKNGEPQVQWRRAA